jgi:putative Ca2+/H+ antiporter (TMEM165/GDT1 family)
LPPSPTTPPPGLAGSYFADILSGPSLRWILGNIPAVLIGERIADRLQMKVIRVTAAVLFA